MSALYITGPAGRLRVQTGCR